MPPIIRPSSATRRDFLRGAAAAAGTIALAPSLLGLAGCATQARQRPAGERLNVGFVGVGGKGKANIDGILGTGEAIVALCDIDDVRMEGGVKQTAAKHPQARRYRDWRELIANESGKGLDCLVVTTPDHMHAPVAMAAMERGIHVYCEKPLTRTVWEARQMRQLAELPGLATQMGNQGSAAAELRRGIEVLRAGVIGPVREVHAWTNRPIWPQGIARPLDTDPVPAGLFWDGFLGVAPARPYKKDVYHAFKWRGWHDFGAGAFGDMGCHTLNLPFRALDLADPIEVEGVATSDHMPETFPASSTVRFRFAARGGLPERTMWWYDGGTKPPAGKIPAALRARGELKGSGVLLIGDGGVLYSDNDYNTSLFIALTGEDQLKAVADHPAAKSPAITLPRAAKGHYQEWIDACRGGPAAFSSFAIASRLTETCLLGTIAQRCPGKTLAWDAAAMRFTNAPDADALVKPVYRPGWTA
jgi:predicted dehydrogenase